MAGRAAGRRAGWLRMGVSSADQTKQRQKGGILQRTYHYQQRSARTDQFSSVHFLRRADRRRIELESDEAGQGRAGNASARDRVRLPAVRSRVGQACGIWLCRAFTEGLRLGCLLAGKRSRSFDGQGRRS